MLNILTTLLLFLAPAAEPPPLFTFPPAVDAVVVGNLVVLVHGYGTTTTVELSELRFLERTPEGFVFALGDPTSDAATNPNVVSTTYDSAIGSHTITTPCSGMSMAKCIARHSEGVTAMQVAFPKK